MVQLLGEAHNNPDNCNTNIGTLVDELGNYSDNTDCGFDGDNATIIFGFFNEQGGLTETLALLGGDPLDGATAGCDAINDIGTPILTDQRSFPRPFGAGCDSGVRRACGRLGLCPKCVRVAGRHLSRYPERIRLGHGSDG